MSHEYLRWRNTLSGPRCSSFIPQAHVVFKPNLGQQRKCENCTDSGIDGVLSVIYDVTRDSNAGELQVTLVTSYLLPSSFLPV